MKLKFKIFILFIFLSLQFGYTQDETQRINDLRNKLEITASSSPGLSEQLNTDIALNNISLSSFLLAVSNIHKINMNVSPNIQQATISNNFSNVNVSTAILFLCKEYSLTIEFTENILSIKPYNSKDIVPKKHDIYVQYNPQFNEVDMDIKDNNLYDVFKVIMDKTGKNLVFAPGMENTKLNAYMKLVNFDSAMEKLALTNNMTLVKTKDNFYVFDTLNKDKTSKSSFYGRINSDVAFEVIDINNQLLNVNFENISIEEIVNQLGDTLAINRFTATPLKEAGNITFRAQNITFDELLNKMFETQTEVITSTNKTITSSNRTNTVQNNSSVSKRKRFTYKKENNIYYFGTEHQLSVRNVEIIRLRHRSVNLMPDTQSDINSSVVESNFNRSNRNVRFTPQGNFNNSNTTRPIDRNYQDQNTLEIEGEEKDILDLIPDEVKEGLDFKVDIELNSIYVTGTGAKIQFFKDFITHIDKPIPVIIIEVMIVEASISNTVETGVEWGIGDNPSTTQGGIFPNTDLTLGAKTINKIINGFGNTSAFNFGSVVPNFFATIKAMETNGDLKIKSTPKLATLNGHRASFSNGQTSYYAVTDRNTFGTDNPVTNEIRNYFPIDAKLGLDIKPYVTGDGQVLLNIKVVQSSFGNRIAEDAPPDINSRNFSSTVRMKDKDIAVLGGLEENFKNNSGSGVPFLARVPIIKWLFSKRKREARKSRLTVFIKPTIID
ncbi:general secretion pathway protein GspD [Winogradskyella sp. PC-19]|uniref:type II secretion system protein GspD n=1 Tax=Winogradskyella sp. PC-19 TaxID=754417 RepID=UPI000B3C08CF|nr:type II secretion system protein GspD [Winogradskyella sp. PC-19]ARV08199.1 general secretion pathway protein GspD [Winogradskyella sp. PC-19]